jgi:hypothetical protein
LSDAALFSRLTSTVNAEQHFSGKNHAKKLRLAQSLSVEAQAQSQVNTSGSAAGSFIHLL